MPIDYYINKIATVSSDDKRVATLACSKYCAFDMRSFNSVHSDGFKQICQGHCWNLVIQHSIGECSKINTLVTASAELATHFKRCKLNHLLSIRLKQHCETRWNSVYDILNSIDISFKEIEEILLQRKAYPVYLIKIDWMLLNNVSEILSFFKKASEQLSADQEPTLHLVLPWINKLKIFRQIKADDLAVIKQFKSILLKFINEKTWLTQLHDISTFLHPITKNLSSYSQYEKSNIHKATRRMLKTLNILEENQEIQQIDPIIHTAKPKKKPKKMRKDDYSQEGVMLEFAIASQDDSSENDEDEIERYAKAKLVISNEESVLQWWKKWSIHYPTLSVLVRSLLGPSCIRINQSAIRPRHQQEIAIQKDHKSVYDKVGHHLNEHYFIPMTATILKQYSNQLLHDLNRSYFSPLSYHDQILALKQAKKVVSIQRKIKKHHLILRVTDKGYNFYIGTEKEFDKKVQNFFQDTNAFIELKENPFNKIQDNVIHLLNQIRAKKFILQWQCNKMIPNRIKCQLAHLYFNPKTYKDGIPVRPIENTIHAPTTNISNYLDEIIRPIFDKECQNTTIIDGSSLIQALHQYMRKGLFKSTTLFCTFDIRNLYTMLPQEGALNILVEFLNVHGYTKVKGIPLETIRLLASIVLKENVFVYGKKMYQQVLGGAMGSSFTLALANIFMWKWQKELVRRQDMIGEYYGRYIDDVFMTWNKSENELKKIIENANTWHPNIKLEYKIGKSLPFLDVLLTNINSTLSTSVYHKPAAEPYVVQGIH
ncbi:unnamed protein product [Rotaria socialis]|uniref:Reverse transcriptase domain-containing protein n=2 Tax=Rotaria socialis TaxID=392032 RepID=A0A818LIJ7_9BILA|nr:unnamed protein product [Rotaria socialis]